MSSESKVVGNRVPIQFTVEPLVAADGTLTEVMTVWVDSNTGPGQKAFYLYSTTSDEGKNREERLTAMSVVLSHPPVAKALGLGGLL